MTSLAASDQYSKHTFARAKPDSGECTQNNETDDVFSVLVYNIRCVDVGKSG